MTSKELRVIRRRRPLLVVLAAASALVLAACGSQVPPSQFVDAQGSLVGAQQGGNGVGGVDAQNPGTGTSDTGTGSTGSATGTADGKTKTGSTGGGSTGGGTTGGGSTGGGSTGGGSTGGGTSGGGHGGGGHGSGGGAAGGSGGGAATGVQAGSCAGFKNTTGITDQYITIANVADLTGPVPALFASAQKAVAAYVAYFNSTSSICGRKLKLMPLDSGTSESGDQQADTTACNGAFAEVGSMGAFDGGGAAVAAKCGIPDLRTASTETARYKSPVSYGVYSLAVPQVPAMPFDWFKGKFGDAYQNAAFVYLNAGASTLNANSFMAAEQKLGFKFKDKIAINVTSAPNYGNIATQLKSDGIKYVQFLGAYQYAVKLKSAMYQAGFNPIFVMDSTGYDANYVSAGKPVDGTYVFMAGPLFEEAGSNPKLQQYLTWLQRTSGGAPSFFGVYAWTAADLFTQLAIQLGGKLTRASLLNAIRGVKKYTDNGLVPPQYIAEKNSPNCMLIIKLDNGKWVRQTPKSGYTCGSVVNSGVGG